MDYRARGDTTVPESFILVAYLFPYIEKAPVDGFKKQVLGRSNLKIDLLCQSRMNLGHALKKNLPDLNIKSCRSYISQIQPHTGYRTGTSSFVDNRRREVISMDKMAISLRGKQIIVELTEPEEIDARLTILEGLRDKEYANKQKLELISTLLDQIGVTETDIYRFKTFYNLLDMASSFISNLHSAITINWDPYRVYIGKMFIEFHSLWQNYYPSYFTSYKDISGTIENKRSQFRSRVGVDYEVGNYNDMENCFNKLEEYLLLPFEQIENYEYALRTILKDYTISSHPDYDNLYNASGFLRETLKTAKERKQASDCERQLEILQDKFTNENLYLHVKSPIDLYALYKKLIANTSLTNSMGKRHKAFLKQHQDSVTSITSSEHGSRRTTQTHSELFTLPPRTLIKEGVVSVYPHNQTGNRQDRYLVLLSDLLLLAKMTHKTDSYQLSIKYVIPLQFAWISEEMSGDLRQFKQTGFLIGWPNTADLTNLLIVLPSYEDKANWCSILSKTINTAREALSTVTLKVRWVVINNERFAFSSEKNPNITCKQLKEAALSSLPTADLEKVTRNIKTPLRGPLSEQFQLFLHVKEHQCPTIGIECAPAIKCFYSIITSLKGKGATQNEDGPSYFSLQEYTDLSTSQSGSRRKYFHFMGRNKNPSKSIISSHRKALFKQPLEKIMIGPKKEALPFVVSNMLVTLYIKGPSTKGIFRLNALQKKVVEVCETLDRGEEVDFKEQRIHVVGAVFKRFLRSIPSYLLNSTRYIEFVATNDINNESERLDRLQKILSKLTYQHYFLSLHVFHLLHKIAMNHEVTCMTASNLGVCLGPTLLQPVKGIEEENKLDMLTLISFLIQHCPELFGEEPPDLFKNLPSSCQVPEIIPLNQSGEKPTTRTLSHGGCTTDESLDSMDEETARTCTYSCESGDSGGETLAHTPLNESDYYQKSSPRSRVHTEYSGMRNEAIHMNKYLMKSGSFGGDDPVTSFTPQENPDESSLTRSTPNSPELFRAKNSQIKQLHRDESSNYKSTPSTPAAARRSDVYVEDDSQSINTTEGNVMNNGASETYCDIEYIESPEHRTRPSKYPHVPHHQEGCRYPPTMDYTTPTYLQYKPNMLNASDPYKTYGQYYSYAQLHGGIYQAGSTYHHTAYRMPPPYTEYNVQPMHHAPEYYYQNPMQSPQHRTSNPYYMHVLPAARYDYMPYQYSYPVPLDQTSGYAKPYMTHFQQDQPYTDHHTSQLPTHRHTAQFQAQHHQQQYQPYTHHPTPQLPAHQPTSQLPPHQSTPQLPAHQPTSQLPARHPISQLPVHHQQQQDHKNITHSEQHISSLTIREDEIFPTGYTLTTVIITSLPELMVARVRTLQEVSLAMDFSRL